jgi:hypothetical protein
MKQVTYYFYLIFITVLLSNNNIKAQNSEFPVGTFVYPDTNYFNQIYNRLDESGLNHIVAIPNQYNQNRLVKLMAVKESEATDYISYYTKGYYTRWEAERDEFALLETGIKHPVGNNNYIDGQVEEYLGKTCWASNRNVGHNVDNLIWGPNYRQDKKYRWFGLINQPIPYNTVFNLALGYADGYLGTTPVCKISVFYRYKISDGNNSSYHTVTLDEETLKVSDFPPNSFKVFTLSYQYPSNLIETLISKVPIDNYTEKGQLIIDTEPSTGIEFRIDWYDVGKLYVDYVDVYDNQIGKDFIQNPPLVSSRIKYYTDKFTNWNSLEYWFAYEEPNTMDSYTPFRIVDSLIQNYQGITKRKPLSTIIYEDWSGQRNGDWHLQKFVNMANPEKLIIDWYPFWVDYPTWEGFDHLSRMFEYADAAKPDFWYVAQGFGEKLDSAFSDYCYWRKPNKEELNASIMLSLAYGSKGTMIWPFSSGWSGGPEILCDTQFVYFDAPLTQNGTPTELYNYIKNDLTRRLKSYLGATLLGLTYAKENLQLRHITPTQNPLPNPPSNDYLTIGLQLTNKDMNWHVGFFNKPDQIDNKYFLMANLWTNSQMTIQVKVTPPIDAPGYSNYRFRNIEPSNNFDITFQTQTTPTLTFPAGEGYLFQVAPVVKYGGKLVYNETINNNPTLFEDMSIESGATLTVNGTYTAKANITVKSGGKIVAGTNGKIIFDYGKQLIIDGSAEIKGTSSANKLALQFSGNNIAVLVKPGSSLTLDYCNLTGAYQGIVTETGARSYVNISNSSISATYCGISLVSGSSSEDLTSQIYKCNLSSTLYGISTSNYNLILIKENTLTGCAINISNSSSAFLQGNFVTGSGSSTTYGVFMSSSTGYVRCNTITNCLNGIHLANSSPDIGGNILQSNLRHGIYLGSGSIPNLVGYLQLNPPLYFPLSGYNKIYSNGSATSTNPIDNDGSEIYLTRANILLSNGCNQISDDRTSTPTMNTQYLISGSLNSGNNINAIYNYWGTKPITSSRFKNLNVTYSPYYTENCPLPDGGSGGGGSETLVLRTSTGLVVDTLIAAEGVPENYSTLQVVYSEADNLFATGNVTQAKPLYEQIIAGNYTTEEKLSAYNRLYAIANITGEDETYFTSLQTTFEDIANNEADTLIKKVYEQNAIKCDVSKEEYLTCNK